MVDFLNGGAHISFFFLICKVLTDNDYVSKSGLGELISPAINRFQTLS